MRALYQYKIPNAFPVGEEATFAQIASNCSCSEAIVRRIMRLAMTNRIFKEVRKGVVVHTATSKALAEDEKFRDYVGMRCEEMCPAELNVCMHLEVIGEIRKSNDRNDRQFPRC
jgi:hypothetical protein